MYKYKFVLIVFFAVMLSTLQTNAQENKVFRAGASQADVSPPIGAKIYGNWVQPSAKSIHDALHAKSLVLDDGETKIALVVVDLVEINKRYIEAAKDLIVSEVDLDRENIMISATHTHSGPSADGDVYVADDAPLNDYTKMLVRKLADGVVSAYYHLEPAEIAWGGVDVPEHVFVRRWILKDSVYSPYGTKDIVKMNPGFENPALVKPSGPIDPEVSFVSIRSTTGRPIAVLANYSLHYVGGVPGDEISADYFSLFGRYMAQNISAEASFPQFVGIMSNGSSGNVNNFDYSKPREHYEPYVKMNRVAKDLADKVYAEMKELKYQKYVPINAKESILRLKVRRASPEVMANVARIQARSENEKPFYNNWEKMYANRVLTMEATWPDSIDITLQAFQIGDLGIATLPFEAFTQTGLEIKDKSPFDHTFTIELANGCLNYLPTPEEIDMGGYETWHTINRVERNASVKITEELLSLFKSLKQQ